MVKTTLRPDVVLWSKTGKKPINIFIELTIPWETRYEEAYERKKAKYTELLVLCKEEAGVLGVRGFYSQSVCRLMTAVGTTGGYPETSQTVERASSWLRREEKS